MRVHRALTALLTSITFATLSAADVLFTSPAAGAQVAAGTINVKWQESGIAPAIADLSQYTLVLMVGGNDDDDMLPLTTFVSQGDFSSGNSGSGTIPSGIAGTVSNGFFFRITSTADAGGTVINYSDRFNITGLTGTTPDLYRHAAEALDGSTVGPATADNVVGLNVTSTSSETAASSTTATLQTSSTAQSATSTTATSVLAAVSGTSTASTTTLAVATAGKNRPDLSPAASAGVGAAVAVVVIALAGALAYAYIRRRRRAAQEVPENPFLDDKAELAADEPGSPQASPNELSPDSQRYEAADGLRPPELDHMAVRAELEG